MQRIQVATLTVGTVLAGSLLCAATTPAAGETGPAGARIGNDVATGKCLTANGGGNGARAIQAPCSGAPNMQWTIIRMNTGGYALSLGQKCLDVKDKSKANGAPVQMWSCESGGNDDKSGGSQLWQLSDKAVGTIVNVNSGKCLDLPNGNKADGVAMQQWDCNGKPFQSWIVLPN